jgi:hypothetical protein
MGLKTATDRAMHVRGLYHQLEERHEGSAWSPEDDMLGPGQRHRNRSRLEMAAGGRWVPDGDVSAHTADKLSESLWWILVIARRLDVDIDRAFVATMDRIEMHLESSLATATEAEESG